MDLPPSDPSAPIRLTPPEAPRVPLVFASPHSGRFYPPSFLEAARLDPLALRRSEDSFIDELFAAAPHHGAPLLAATFPRAWCDPNRARWELDPAMFEDRLPDFVATDTPRVVAGLGTIARVVASGEGIYRRKLRFAEAVARIETCWDPYHAALETLIADTERGFGAVLLVDCHSMPAPPGGGPTPDVILGDAHGTACAETLIGFVEQYFTGLGLRVVRNEPYAGGFTTRHYGRPSAGRHALQIELARRLYMDERLILPGPGFAGLKNDLGRLIAALARHAATVLRRR